MNKQRTLLIALLAAVQLCTACGISDSPGDVTTTDQQTVDAVLSTTEAAETTIAGPDIPAIDGGGDEFRMLGRSVDNTFPIHEFMITEVTGDTVDNAVYKRNRYLEDKYKIKIVADEATATEIRETMQRNIQANDSTYDLYMPSIRNAFILTLEGALYNIEDIPYVNIDNPWWQARMLDNFSISNANFFLIGDMNPSIFNAIGVIYLNEKVAEDNNIPNVYQTVRDGKWTLDLMHEYSTAVTRDLDGDQIVGITDMWGFITGNFAWQTLFYGSGESFSAKNSQDIPSLTWDTEKNINVITKITELLNDESATLLTNQAQFKGVNAQATFKENRALFRQEYIYNIYQIRDMETNFGLLPAPKYDESQTNYYSAVHTTHSSATCVPTTNNRIELTGAILEDMAYQSYITIRPAFYDNTLVGRFARNEDTVEMLNLIYANINTDLSLAMATTGLTIDADMRAIYTEDRSEFMSAIAASKELNATIIETNVSKILELLK